MYRHPLVEQLIKARVALGISQRDLASKVQGNAAGAPLWRWETQGRNPNLHNFIAWANALGFNVKLEKINDQ